MTEIRRTDKRQDEPADHEKLLKTREQSRLMQEAGCKEGQGYLFSRPLPIEEYEKFVYSRKE